MTITRRDFLQGTALAVGSTAAARAAAPTAVATAGGFSGQTDALNATAHALRDDPARWRNTVAERDEGVEDLVVVGAGISGLAGAHLYQRHAGRPVRMLVLDALDEVGGHARRNEFVSRSGRRLIGYGGSQSLDTPSFFSPAVSGLLQDIGIDLQRFDTEFYDKGWAARHGLVRQGRFFDSEVWGREAMVIAGHDDTPAQWLPRTPLPAQAQADWVRIADGEPHPWRGITPAAARTRLAGMSYRDYLLQVWRADPALATCLAHTTRPYFGVGIDATSALDAWASGELPGFDGLDLGDAADRRMSPSGRLLHTGEDDYIHHFPDGNHAVARALLRAMRPELLPGRGMETLSDAVLNTAALDDPAAALRVRLRATVVALRHLGPPQQASLVELRYVDGQGRVRLVRARHVLLAGWHRSTARLSDEIPAAQREALDDQVKVPLVYVTALLSNSRAWQRAGIASIQAPGGFWDDASLDYPVNLGAQRAPASPDEPILLHLSKVVVSGDGSDPRLQSRIGRALLMGWGFEHFETQMRRLLQGALGAHGFDFARDVEAITINRWAHGYSYEYMRPWDRFWPAGALPVAAARRGWGRVAIAGADSGAYAYAHSAIDQATRAVQQLLPQARLPAWSRFPGPPPQRIGL